MEQDPSQKDKKKKQGKKGVAGSSHSVSCSQITLWPLDDTSHQQSAAELFTDIQSVGYLFKAIKFTSLLFWSSVIYIKMGLIAHRVPIYNYPCLQPFKLTSNSCSTAGSQFMIVDALVNGVKLESVRRLLVFDARKPRMSINMKKTWSRNTFNKTRVNKNGGFAFANSFDL